MRTTGGIFPLALKGLSEPTPITSLIDMKLGEFLPSHPRKFDRMDRITFNLIMQESAIPEIFS